ncbi:pilus assembly protein TadG-related protein [Mesorhizobium sp. AaZ16]|uniref:pilus assembly protein TadG-related protein n=1 Tax=Mesorhizobium sp. AaZ16 TaxID=3402289 RepID=UPI00374F6F1C
MRIFDKARQVAGSFTGDRRGNFAILTGVIASMLMLSVGLGVNVAQSYQLKSSLQNALDAAVTSTARDLTTGAIEPEEARKMVEAFLGVNSDPKFATTEQFVLEQLVIDRMAKTIEATAYANVNLAFPIFSTKDPRVSITSAAVYSDKTIEVAMMLDVTGSMGGHKINDLKTAAKNAVDAFLDGQDPKKPRVRVAIVPYANSVNAGSLAGASVFVERKTSDRKQAPGSDDPIAVSGSATRLDNCATERKGSEQYTDAGPDVSMVNRDLLLTEFSKESRTRACPVAALTPLTADAAALKATIKDFVAEGGTGGHIGIQWAWYMLSERWSGVLEESARPTKFDPKKIGKYAILMTDGEFNLSYFDASESSEVYNGAGKEPTRTAAKKLCAAMRAQNIEIFSVGFKLENSYAKDVMKDCATPDTGSVKHYYQTSTGAELDKAFQEIARNIEGLALTK